MALPPRHPGLLLRMAPGPAAGPMQGPGPGGPPPGAGGGDDISPKMVAAGVAALKGSQGASPPDLVRAIFQAMDAVEDNDNGPPGKPSAGGGDVNPPTTPM